MLKRAVRAAFRKVRGWLAEDSELDRQNYDDDASLYPWLNALCLKVLANNGRRPDYVWGVVQGVNLAKALGIRRVSVIELGVAGGNGLLALEAIAEQVERMCGVAIDVYGFDTGRGLPKPQDYRDLPNLYVEGAYPMDRGKLQQHLKRARLVLGDVEDTIPQFLASNCASVAFISFDLDLYTSTMHALKLLEADQRLLLPRVHCYFDDILGYTFSDWSGELLAISEFNTSQEKRKISKINGLRYYVPARYADQAWVEKFYLAHIFDHDLYGHYDGLNKRMIMNLDI